MNEEELPKTPSTTELLQMAVFWMRKGASYHPPRSQDLTRMLKCADYIEEHYPIEPAHCWSKDHPTKDGYYWFRDEDGDTQLLEWDAKHKWGHKCGNDIAYTYDDWGNDLQGGEWWTEEITPPEEEAK